MAIDSVKPNVNAETIKLQAEIQGKQEVQQNNVAVQPERTNFFVVIFNRIKDFFYTHFTSQGRLEVRSVKLYNRVIDSQAKINQTIQKVNELKAKLAPLDQAVSDIKEGHLKDKASEQAIAEYNVVYDEYAAVVDQLEKQKNAHVGIEDKFKAHRTKHFGLKIVNEQIERFQAAFNQVEANLKSTDLALNEAAEKEIGYIVEEYTNFYHEYQPIIKKHPEASASISQLSAQNSKITRLLEISKGRKEIADKESYIAQLQKDKQAYMVKMKEEMKAGLRAHELSSKIVELKSQKQEIVEKFKQIEMSVEFNKISEQERDDMQEQIIKLREKFDQLNIELKKAEDDFDKVVSERASLENKADKVYNPAIARIEADVKKANDKQKDVVAQYCKPAAYNFLDKQEVEQNEKLYQLKNYVAKFNKYTKNKEAKGKTVSAYTKMKAEKKIAELQDEYQALLK